MRKIVTSLVVALLTAAAAHAQTPGIQFGVKAGLSMAVLDGTLNKGSDYKAGLHLGGFVRWRPTQRFALQPELVYAQQGSENSFSSGGVPFESETKLTYLNVPIMAKVYLGKIFFLQAGPQFGVLLAAREIGQTSYSTGGSMGPAGYTTADVDVKKDYKGDVAFCAGLGVDLPMGLGIAARLNYGFTDINQNEQQKQLRDYFDIGGLHNRVAEVSVSYAFGGKK